MNEIKKPAIRFKGFSDGWEEQPLGNIFEEYSEKGYTELPPLTIIQGEGTICRDESDRTLFYDKSNLCNYKMVKKGDFIVHLRSFEGGLEIATQTGLVSPAYHIFHGENTDSTFYYSYFRSKKFIDTDLKPHVYGIRDGRSIDIEGMKTINIPYTSYEEQAAIGTLIEKVDSLIALRQHKCDKSICLKKSMLERMFPKGGADVPEIRFKGFTEAWKQYKLGEIGKARSGFGFPDNEQGGISGIPFFKVSDMNLAGNEYEMTVANNYVTQKQIKFHRWSPIKDLPAVFFAKVGAAVMLNRKRLCRFPFLMDNNTMAYSFDEKLLDSTFTKSLFETVDLTSLVQIGALPSYNTEDVEQIEVYLPSISEQQCIGEYFENLDNLILFYQQELEKLQSIEKALLEKMFV